MKVISKQENVYFIRFDAGEEFIQGIKDACQQNGITAGSFTAIGAGNNLTLSFYNLQTKQYQDKTFAEDLEIAGIIGNVGLLNGELAVHAHGSFGKENFETISGHVKSLTITGTCEITLTKLPDNSLVRAYDEKTGLNLIQ